MEATVTSESNGPTKRKPWQLIAILAVTFIPLVAAYVAYFTGIGVPQDTVNNGQLLEPAKNIETIMGGLVGDEKTIEQLEKNPHKAWRILIPVTEQCNEDCANNLYVTRQVHIRLGEKGERVERYAINLGGPSGLEFLSGIAEQYPNLSSLALNKAQWQRWLNDSNAPSDIQNQPYYLLIDQVGFAMMFYTADNHGNELLKDIKRVLRYSPD